MRIIFKYLLKPGTTHITLPRDFRILAIHAQNGQPYIWIEHSEPSIDSELHLLVIFGRATGQRWLAESTGTYLDSAFDLFSGREVWHFYKL